MSHSRGAGADPDEIPGGVAAGEQRAGGDDQFRRADLGRDAQLGVGMGEDHAIV